MTFVASHTTAQRQSTTDEAEVLRAGRKLVSDLLTPRPWIYWTDLLLSLTLGYGAAALYLAAPLFSITQFAAFAVAGLALYRASVFMHEIVHFRKGEMRAFTIVWNVLAGIPMLVPSFLYESHLAHHNTRHCGTRNDGEYLPLGLGSFRHLLGFLGQILLLPAFVVFRFGVLVPISFVHPRLRRWVLEHASSFVINFRHRREIRPHDPLGWWAALDIACFLRVAAMLALVAVGLTDWTRLPKLYAIAMFTLGLNHLRTLVAHRYLSDGRPISHAGQLHDSVNIEGIPLLTELLCPLSLRYHALHHLFPSVPYHHLATAHRRLMEGLPADSPYHAVTFPGFTAAVCDLLKNIRRAMRQPELPACRWYRGTAERKPAEHRRPYSQRRRADLSSDRRPSNSDAARLRRDRHDPVSDSPATTSHDTPPQEDRDRRRRGRDPRTGSVPS